MGNVVVVSLRTLCVTLERLSPVAFTMTRLVVLSTTVACVLGVAATADGRFIDTSQAARSSRCAVVEVSVGSKLVRVTGMNIRLAGAAPARHDRLVYLPLSFFRSALGMLATWDARTGEIKIDSGVVHLRATVRGERYSLDGRSSRLAGAVFTLRGEPMLPAGSALSALGFAVAQDPAVTHVVVVPVCAIGTPQETPYLKLLASGIRRGALAHGERVGVVGTVLSASSGRLVVREVPIAPSLGRSVRVLFASQHPAYAVPGATIRVGLTAATRGVATVPISALTTGTLVLVAGHVTHRRLVAEAVVDLTAAPPAGPSGRLSPLAPPTGVAASGGARRRPARRGHTELLGETVATAAQASTAGSSATAVFSGGYGLPELNWSSPAIGITAGCATLAVQATIAVGAGTSWDWPMRFSAAGFPSPFLEGQPGGVSLEVTPESPGAYANSFSTASGAVASIDLTLALDCWGLRYTVDLGGPTVGGALANATSAPAPLYGASKSQQVPSSTPGCLPIGLSVGNVASAWGFTAIGLNLCTTVAITPAVVGGRVSIAGLTGSRGGGLAVSAANDPLLFEGALGSQPVTLSFSDLSYAPAIDVGFSVQFLAANQVIATLSSPSVPSAALDAAVASTSPTLSALVVPVTASLTAVPPPVLVAPPVSTPPPPVLPSAPAIIAGSFNASPSSLTSSGGTTTVSASVQNATTCELSVTPAVAALPISQPCSGGNVSFRVELPGNPSSSPVD